MPTIKITEYIMIVIRTLLAHIVTISTIIVLIWWIIYKQNQSKPSLSTMDVTWSSPDTFPYDGNPHELTVSGYPTGATIDYTGGEDGFNGATNKGSYSINAIVTAPGYKIWKDTHILTIGRMDPTTNLTVTVSNWINQPTYGYTTQPEATLSYTGGTLNGGTITYSIDSTSSNPNDFEIVGNTTLKLKLGKNASTYKCKIKATITGDTDYADGDLITSNETSISVSKANIPTPTWSTPNTFTYDGNSHSINITNLPSGVTATYSGGESSGSSTSAGTYTITATINGGTNYNSTTSSSSLTINKAPLPPQTVISWSSTDTFTYDGSSHTITVSGYPTGSTVTYTGGENGSNGSTSGGTYTITATVTNPNYQTWTGTHTLTINKAPIPSTPTWSSTDTFTYNGTVKTITVSGYATGSTVTYTGGENGSNGSTSAGTYTITATVTNPNYQTWTGTHTLTINKAPIPSTPTWSSTDTFTYDGNSHTITVSGYPTGSTVTYTGGENGSNGSTSTGTYTITATVTNPNYQTWTGTHTLTINPAVSYIKLQNGTIHYIDTSGNFCTNRRYDYTFDFTDTSGVSQTITRSDIKEIHLVDLPQITTAPNKYLYDMCYDFTNLTVADIQIPNTITSVGDTFCYDMFYNCTSLTSLPSGFNLPQNITTTGEIFCVGMFEECTSLTSLPSGFNLPQSITTSATSSRFFCAGMFSNCASLTSLPSGFNLPQGITGSVGRNFCGSMFQGCSQLTSLPSGFNIPQGITSVLIAFCYCMFYQCTSLTSLPSGFNIPQGITSVDEGFLARMFGDCTGLRNNSSNFITITIPNVSTAYHFCFEMFVSCSNLSGVVSTPTPGTQIKINKS